MIGGDGFESFFGLTGANHQDILVGIVTRALKFGGYSVVLLQPGGVAPACTATDTAIKRGHRCSGNGHLPFGRVYDVLSPPENLAKTRPMVTSAVARATARYTGGPLNLAVLLSSLEGPIPDTTHGAAGGLLVVPPSVVAGEAVRLGSR